MRVPLDPALPDVQSQNMLPLRDHNASETRPYVVYAVLAANVLAFFWYSSTFTTPRDLHIFYAALATVPAEITNGEGQLTLLTSMFIHGGLMHLGGNMLFLWIFGDNMEDAMGHLPFLLFYLASGVGATLLHVASDPTSNVPMIGASGAIAGIMGGYMLMFPRARDDILLILIVFFRIIPVPAWLMLGLWLGMQLLGGFGTSGEGGGVAYWAHAGGFFVGVILTLPLWLRRGGTRFWQKTVGSPPHPERAYRIGRSHIPRVQPRQPQHPRHPGPWGR